MSEDLIPLFKRMAKQQDISLSEIAEKLLARELKRHEKRHQ